jgi:hypothetical protein
MINEKRGGVDECENNVNHAVAANKILALFDKYILNSIHEVVTILSQLVTHCLRTFCNNERGINHD